MEVHISVRNVNFRTKFRKQANAADNKAATIIIDSLINYEAVKVHILRKEANTSISTTRNIKSNYTIQQCNRMRNLHSRSQPH
jgi:ABC-type transport system involved in Fe-S cluster assembly fused permease/ATPase subunit